MRTESIGAVRKEIIAVMDRAKKALLVAARAPIKPFVYDDEVTGQKISLDVSSLYTTLSIDGRDYYFTRETGEFCGTGMAAPAPQ